MNSKTFPVDGMVNELEGASVYFERPPLATPLTLKPDILSLAPSSQRQSLLNLKEQKEGDNLSTLARMQASKHESKHESIQDDFIETIRKTVRQVGKEELYVRLTPEEKRNLRKVVYQYNETYGGTGRKTSENEVSRIAIKFLLEDYQTNGEKSILAVMQAVLHA